MRSRLSLACLPLLAAFLIVPACVELTGQRISWYHDVAADRLQILIHYDGIHEGKGSRDKGSEQIPRFIAKQEILIGDWPLHFKWDVIGDDEDPTGGWRRLIERIDARVIGHYREPTGQIGALQLVTIEKVSEFFTELNRQISATFLASEGNSDFSGMPRTSSRVRAAAEAGFGWLSLEGHALRFSWPIDRGEWVGGKREMLKDLFKAVIRDQKREGIAHIEVAAFFARLLSTSPVSYMEEAEQASLILGYRDRPPTLRMDLHGEYETSLEEVVLGEVELDLDRELARFLLDEKTPDADSAIDRLISWGPAEAQVRPLLQQLGSEGATARGEARDRLQRWADRWNRDGGWPVAPTPDEDLAAYRQAWSDWYREIKGEDAEEK